MMIGPDPNLESFIKTTIGGHYRFEPAWPVSKFNTQSTRQWSRFAPNNPDYVAGISQTIRSGGYISPVLTRAKSKDTLEVLDGIHRIKAAAAVQRETMPAYVLLDCDDELAEFVASHVNVFLNGQGLTEEERRLHFIATLHRRFTDLTRANLSDPQTKKSIHLLSIAPSTAKRWLDVELFKLRVVRLGLKMPTVTTDQHTTGERTEAWVLLIARFTDEELQKYWPQITGVSAHHTLKKVVRELDRCTSSAARASLAEDLIPQLLPTIRQLSHSRADTERQEANRIRMHAAALIKLQDKLPILADKYPDVRNALLALQRLFDAISLEAENGSQEDARPSAH